MDARNSGVSEEALKTVSYILGRYDLQTPRRRRPIEIPNAGRDDLASLFAELDCKSIVEVGVERAKYSEVLCRENPQAKVYLVDPWRAYSGYRDHVDQGQLDEFLQTAKDRLAPYDNWQIVRKFSMDAAEDFEDGSLDAVYIDGNHTLPYVINDIIKWSEKIRVGGIISGHDYRESRKLLTQNQVVYAVDCYTRSYRIVPWFLWGRKAKVPGEIRESHRSWMWVKPR